VKRWCSSTRLHVIVNKKTVMLIRTSDLIRCRKLLSKKDSDKGVWHHKLQYVVCLQFGKHTITQAIVDRCALSCVGSI
jgi:hypothetical protein